MAKNSAPIENDAVELDLTEAEELAGIAKAEAEGTDRLDGIPREKAAKADKPEKEKAAGEQPRDEAGKFKGKEGADDGAARPAQEQKPEAQQRTVPHGAFHEERESRKAAERALADERRASAERFARLEERLRLLTEARQAAPQPPPDPRKDVFGAINYQDQRLANVERHFAEQMRTAQDQAARQQQENRIMGSYRQAAQRYRQSQPDFDAAYTYAIQSRAQEHLAFGADPATVQELLRQDELAIAAAALDAGNDPAEMLYHWATARGYRPGQVQAAPPAGQEQRQEAPPANGKGNGAEQIKRLADAQEASESLSRAGGGASGAGKITLESLDRMTDDEFKAFTKKMNAKDPNGMDKLFARLEGGAR